MLVVFSTSLIACHQKHEEHPESTFVITTPMVADTIMYQEYVSQIEAFQHIELRALERGYLEQILVDEGQVVKKGQLLFKLKPSIYQAEVSGAKAEKEYVEIEYRTTKQLAENNVVSSNELALAKAKLDKAKAVLELANAHLGFTEIRAPFDGIMGRFEVRLGSLLEEGELLTTLSNNSKMWVYFNVPEAAYLSLRMTNEDQHLPKVKLQMANAMLFKQEGIIEAIEADFNNETGNIAFRATFENPGRLLRHGETGNVLLPVELNKALIIPQRATFEILDKKYVYVVDSQNRVHSREIVVGAELPHLFVVTKGLSSKDTVLLDGIRKVKNNQKIKTEFVSVQADLDALNHLEAE